MNLADDFEQRQKERQTHKSDAWLTRWEKAERDIELLLPIVRAAEHPEITMCTTPVSEMDRPLPSEPKGERE